MVRVLVVDDEKIVREGIAEHTDWEGLGCELMGTASDGEEASRLAKLLRPGLIISDIRMPKLSGLEMLEELRRENSGIKVIFLTAHSDFHYAQRALKLGASDYILKPFSDGELENAVRRVLGRGSLVQEGEEERRLSLPALPENANRYVKEAVLRIRERYREREIGISLIAGELGVSEGHLSRLFKKDMGISLSSYLTMYRIRVSLRLLRDLHYRVYEVAELVGYHDLGYFSQTFRKLTGLLPSEYQARPRD